MHTDRIQFFGETKILAHEWVLLGGILFHESLFHGRNRKRNKDDKPHNGCAHGEPVHGSFQKEAACGDGDSRQRQKFNHKADCFWKALDREKDSAEKKHGEDKQILGIANFFDRFCFRGDEDS